MKKLFLTLLLLLISSAAIAQSSPPNLIGTWKIVLKTSGLKKQPASEYLLIMDDSVYTIGVDSIGNSLHDVSSGRWSVLSDGTLLLYPSDRIAERRYYKPAGENRYRYIGTTLKKNSPVLEMDIFLEKFIKK